MKKYITIERVIIIIAIAIILFLLKDCRHSDTLVKTIPEYIKTTDTIIFNHIQEKKIYIQGKVIRVDSARYTEYKREKDTIRKDSMYTDAVTIRKYDTIIEDNDRIKLEVNSEVDGRLIKTSAKYTIKEIKVEPIVRRPNASLLLGAGVNFNKSVFLSAGVQIRNGFILQGTIDNNSNYSIGCAKAFTILK